jgi:hypothetical protein
MYISKGHNDLRYYVPKRGSYRLSFSIKIDTRNEFPTEIGRFGVTTSKPVRYFCDWLLNMVSGEYKDVTINFDIPEHDEFIKFQFTDLFDTACVSIRNIGLHLLSNIL